MPLAEHPMTIAYVSSCQQGNFMIYVSSQVENLGFTTEAWLGKPDLRLQQIHEDDLEQVEKAMWHSCRTAEKLSCRYRLYDNAGNIRWFHDEATVMCDESGAPLFMMGAMRDITEIKEMEEELNEHRYYLEKKVEQRTEQLLKRITLLESCNATLCDKLAQARRDIAALRGQLAGAMSGVGANDCLGRNGVVKNMIKPGEKDDWIGCLASA
jgi:PAS domain S-box-containing protein